MWFEERMAGTPNHPLGKRYWSVKVTADIANDGNINLLADNFAIRDGCLEFYVEEEDDFVSVLAIPAGKWLTCWSASMLDGNPVYVERWGREPSAEDTKPAAKSAERAKMTPRLRWEILAKGGYKCAVCGRKAEDGAMLEVDHIQPVSAGGKTEPGNLQTLCFECNRGKHKS